MPETSSTSPTKFLKTEKETYAYRRFGAPSKRPLIFLQHFTGPLDNWDPAVTDPLAQHHDIVLFENAGVGRSTGKVPPTITEMAEHVFVFLDALGTETCDVLGYSLGGMIAQHMVLDRPKIFAR